jgi:hypothetical protein
MSIDKNWRASRHVAKDVFLEINSKMSKAQTKLRRLLDAESLPSGAGTEQYTQEVVDCLAEVALTNNQIGALAQTIGRENFVDLTAMFAPPDPTPADAPVRQGPPPEQYAAKLGKSKEEKASENLAKFLEEERRKATEAAASELYAQASEESPSKNRAARRKKTK